MIELESALDPGWIPGETSPQQGLMINHDLAMTLRFNSALMTVSQTEFTDFNYFQDQTCKIFDVLRQTFEIKKINIPSLETVWQRGFDDMESAEANMNELGLCEPRAEVLSVLGGHMSAISYTICSEEEMDWQDEFNVVRRRRLDVKTVRQERQLAFDERMMQRARLLPDRQREALQGLANLRKKHATISPYAVQLTIEQNLEAELPVKLFELVRFLDDGWAWAQSSIEHLPKLNPKR